MIEDADASSAESRPKKSKVDPSLVERLWACQPVCGGKRKATRPEVAKALEAALKRGGEPADIEAAFRAYYDLPDCTRDGGQYARGAAVLLNDDKWRDFLPDPAKPTASAWAGPPEVEAAMIRAFGPEKGRGYLARFCAWQDVPAKALICTNAVICDFIRKEAGASLKALGVRVLLKDQAA